jgi:hypothetical protein
MICASIPDRQISSHWLLDANSSLPVFFGGTIYSTPLLQDGAVVGLQWIRARAREAQKDGAAGAFINLEQTKAFTVVPSDYIVVFSCQGSF